MEMKTNNTTNQAAPVERGPAWRAAEAAGIDMSLLERSLAMTPWERMQEHQAALDFAHQLQEAIKKRHAES